MKGGWGGRFSYTYSVLKDNLRRREQLLHRGQPGAAGQQLQLPRHRSRRARAGAAVHHRLLRPVGRIRLQRARRAAPRDPGADRRAALRRRPPLGEQQQLADLLIGGWTVVVGRSTCRAASRSTCSRPPTRASASAARRRRTGRTSSAASISRPPAASRIASRRRDHPTATWINPAAFALAPPAPSATRRARSPTCARRGNTTSTRWCMKNVGVRRVEGGADQVRSAEHAQPPERRALQGANTVGSSNFGQTTIQAGFMRITQVMVRFSF